MALQVMRPNQASGVLTPASSSTDCAMDFGFPATAVRIVNDRATAVYVNFNSTAMSTAGFKTCSQEAIEMTIPPCSGIGVISTATSTGTFVRVLALGG